MRNPSRSVWLPLAAAFLGLGLAPAAGSVTFDWVSVGDPGNACDPQGFGRCFGAVGYAYRIAKYEVTNAQYAEFLNAKAASDPLGLYNQNMGSWGGIARSGSAGSYTYSVVPGRESRPVAFVSPFDWLFLTGARAGSALRSFAVSTVSLPSASISTSSYSCRFSFALRRRCFWVAIDPIMPASARPAPF